MKRLFRLPFSRARVQRDVDTELAFHILGRIEELMARGMSRQDAEREAQRRFGDPAAVAHEVARIDVETHKRRVVTERLSAFARDLRYALRGLTRRPLYALTIVITLAVGIGANTTVFSVFETVLLRPLPVRDLDQLLVVQDDFPKMNARFGVSALEALDLFERRDLFQSATTTRSAYGTLLVSEEPTHEYGVATLGDFAGVFGVRPLLGRFYEPAASQFGRPPVVVLSHELWQRLGGDSTIAGKILKIGDQPYEVSGVMPGDFTYPSNAQFWRPLVLDSRTLNQTQSRGTVIELFVGRMQPGLTTERVGSELRALAERWHQQYPGNYQRGGHTMVVIPLVDRLAGQLKPIVIALLSTVGLVLLLACANVASLQLMHTTGRARELAVRAALGAGRAAIARQVILESLILAIAGGIAGVLLGVGSLTWLTKLNIGYFPALKDVRLDGMVLAFTAGATVLAALLFGSVPVLRTARVRVNDALRESVRGSSTGAVRHRFLRASVIFQTAIAVVLLVAAGLTIRSLGRLLDVELGFQAENVATFTFFLPSQRYPEGPQRIAFLNSLDERLRTVPGVQSVGFALGTPFSGSAGSTLYDLPGVPKLPGESDRHANQAFVYGDYFRTMGIPIVRGRAFTVADYAAGGHTVIIDETLVKRSFGDRDPIGQQIKHGPSGTIIGVAKSVKLGDLSEPAHPLVYHNYGRSPSTSAMTAALRSSLPIDAVVKAVRTSVKELDPSLAAPPVYALTQRIADSYGHRQFATRVLTIFAALALGLALLGVYAVTSYVVTSRTREIGIRLALGAARAEIARMVLRDGAILATAGLVIGAAVFTLTARFFRALLFGVGVLDPVALGAAVVLLACVTLLASYLPARRAVRVDPMLTMRTE
ncbi:MAG: ADOP family duplicated permease [Gemmatimonadaceae bacterium]